MRIAVNRKALEINKRIVDKKNHHPPIIVESASGTVKEFEIFTLPRNRTWIVMYDPDNPWTCLDMEFTVWIESFDNV